jgi:organic radical activating enzyme
MIQFNESLASLPIMEAFYTLQGEGAFQGHAAYFIRLGGCDVGCHWCDVKESWDVSKHPQVKIQDIVATAQQNPARLAVITGGEPLMHNLDELCIQLKKVGFRTHIETSGAYKLSGDWDWICLSPKKFKAPVAEVIQKAHELKVIIYNKSDFLFAEKYAQLVPKDCLLLLQPEWDRREVMLPLVIDYVKKYPKWKISLQTHKFMDIP